MGHDGGLPRFHPDEFRAEADRLPTSPSPPIMVADPVAESGFKFYERENQDSLEAQIAAKIAEEARLRNAAIQLQAQKRTTGLITKAAIEQAQAKMNPKK